MAQDDPPQNGQHRRCQLDVSLDNCESAERGGAKGGVDGCLRKYRLHYPSQKTTIFSLQIGLP